MKKILTISLFFMFGCATTSSITSQHQAESDLTDIQAGIDLTDIQAIEFVEEAKDPESFAHCMRYDENITLTGEEELALLDHCLGK